MKRMKYNHEFYTRELWDGPEHACDLCELDERGCKRQAERVDNCEESVSMFWKKI